MFKAVLFDFGGVIYQHPKEVIPEVLARIYNRPVEITIKEYGKYKDDYFTGRLSTDKFITTLSSVFKSNKSIKQVKNLWLKYYGKLAKPNIAVINIIKRLHKNYKVYLFSNTTEMSNIHNSKTGLYDNFDGLFFSYRIGMKKPDQEIYEKVLSAIGFQAQECIFIDDDIKNIEVAMQMGFKTILFNVLIESSSALREKLKKLRVII